MLLFLLVPIAGPLWLLILFCKDGEKNKNDWGERPIELEASKTDIILNHIFVILLFVGISCAYFSPVMQGKKLETQDIKHWKATSKEVVDFRDATGEEALWTNSMFSGMPAYLVSVKYKGNLIKYVAKTLSLGIPRPANLLFLYLLGFYILLFVFRLFYNI